MSNELTIKQEKACREYIKTGDMSAAYRFAYNTADMKPATINRKAKELFDLGKISARVNQLRDKIAKRNDISIDRILEEERCLAYLDPAQLFELESDQWTLIAPPELPESVRRAISAISVKRFTPKGGDPYTEYKYKFWDKGRSLERVGRHKGMYDDKLTVGFDDKLIQALQAVLPPEMYEAMMAKLVELTGTGKK